MQQGLRPYATTGVAIVGAGLIAVAPIAPPLLGAAVQPPSAQHRVVQLTAGPGDIITPYAELFGNTANNLAAMGSHALEFPILQQFLSDPAGTIANLPNAVALLTSVLPEISTTEAGQTVVALPPLWILALSVLGPGVNVNNAIVDIARQIFDPNSPGDPLTAILGAPAILLNALLNGQSSFDLAGIHLPLFSGLLVPGNAADIDVDAEQLVEVLNLGDKTPIDILDELGLGQQQLAVLVNNLLGVFGLADQTVNGVLGQIGLADTSMADLATVLTGALGIGNPTVTELVGRIGLADTEMADVAKNILTALGLGNPTVSELVGDTGLGDISVADLTKNLLDATGIGNPTVSELLVQLGGGDMTVGGVLGVTLRALGLDGVSPEQLLDAMGGGHLTLVGTINGVLDSMGLGGQTVPELLGAWDVLDVPMGTILREVLGETGDLSMAQILDAGGLGELTVQDLVTAVGPWPGGMGEVSLGDLFRNLIANGDLNGGGGTLPNVVTDLTINDLITATGGTPLSKGGDATMLDGLDDNTINNLLSQQVVTLPDGTEIPMTEATLSEMLGVQAQVSLADFIDQSMPTTFGALLNTLTVPVNGVDTPLPEVSLNQLVAAMTTDSPLAALFPNVGLGELIGQFGLDDISITSLLNDMGIGEQHLFALIDDMLGDTTVGSLVDDSDIGSTDLFTLIEQALAGTTVASLLDDAGIGGQHLDSVFDQLFGTTTLAAMLSDAGIGDVELSTLISQLLGGLTVEALLGDLGHLTINEILDDLGLADLQLVNANVGEFFGSVPYLFNGLTEQLAQALGA